MRVWLILIACGLVTYLSRTSFIALGDRVSVPPRIERALKYVAPAAFTAIMLPLVLGGNGFSGFSEDLPRIIASVVGGLVILKWHSIPYSLIAGMCCLWLLEWIGL
jgi:branched-subunit amino acid transport protein